MFPLSCILPDELAGSPRIRRNLAGDFDDRNDAGDCDSGVTRSRTCPVAPGIEETKEHDTMRDEGMFNMYIQFMMLLITCMYPLFITIVAAEAVASPEKFAALDSDGENDERTGRDDDDLTGEGEPLFGIDEDGPPQPELLFDASLLE